MTHASLWAINSRALARRILTDSSMVVCERIGQLTPGQHIAAQIEVSQGFRITAGQGETTYDETHAQKHPREISIARYNKTVSVCVCVLYYVYIEYVCAKSCMIRKAGYSWRGYTLTSSDNIQQENQCVGGSMEGAPAQCVEQCGRRNHRVHTCACVCVCGACLAVITLKMFTVRRRLYESQHSKTRAIYASLASVGSHRPKNQLLLLLLFPTPGYGTNARMDLGDERLRTEERWRWWWWHSGVLVVVFVLHAHVCM